MKMTKRKNGKFVCNAERNREPVKIFEERRYVYALALLKKEASCAVLYTLKASQLISRDTRECRVAVVQSRSNSGMQKDRSRLKGKERTDSSNSPKG